MNPTEYAKAVVDVLAADFPDLIADPAVARLLEKKVAEHAVSPDPIFEWILDSPTAANWRLKAHHMESGKVRVACYRTAPTGADAAREETLNGRLAAL